jgi:hypothetical protein
MAMFLEATINALKPQIQEQVIQKLAPVIQENLKDIDVLKTQIDEKLGEVSKTVKTLIPGSLQKMVDVTMVNEMVDSIDSSVFKTAFDEIIDKLTEEQVTAAGSSKEELKTKIGGLPDDIKKMFKIHIQKTFSTDASATEAADAPADKATAEVPAEGSSAKVPAAETMTATESPTTGASAEGSSSASANVTPASDEELTNAITKMNDKERSEMLIDTLQKFINWGVPKTVVVDAVNNLHENVMPPAPQAHAEATTGTKSPAEATPTEAKQPETEAEQPTTEAKGGAKKRRRKTKKNIRRPKKSYTKFGRKF